MLRDFSDSAKQKLLEYVDDSADAKIWDKVADWFSDIPLEVENWMGNLDIKNYVDNVSGYHEKVMERRDVTTKQIEQIFTDVQGVDTNYLSIVAEQITYGNKMVQLIKDMADMINPNGGNLSVEQMTNILGADIEALNSAEATKQKEIDEEMLGTNADGAEMSEDPVNLSTGNFIYDHEDLKIGGEIPLSFHRYYNSKDTSAGVLGKCFLHNYEMEVKELADGKIRIRQQDGQIISFCKSLEGKYIPQNIAMGEFEKSEEGYIYTKLSKERVIFNTDGKMKRQEDTNGRGITFSYDERKRLVEAKTDTGASLSYSYDINSGNLVKVSDHTGRCVEMSYQNGNLERVKIANGAVYTYHYGEDRRITEVVNAREIVAVKNEYDKKYRVTRQVFPDGGTMEFEYDDENQRVIMTERDGRKIIHVHDDRFRNTQTIYEDGTRERYLYNDRNQCISKTDRNGHTTRMAYDNRGNLTQIIDASKRRTNLTYDGDNHLLTVSINGKERLKNHYDVKGTLIATENCLNESLWIAYDMNKRPVEFTFADGSKTTLRYDERGNISSIKEANGNEVSYVYDRLNRVIETKDVNDNLTQYEYDLRDKITKVTNPLGDTKEYTYDKVGRVTGIKDFDGFWTLSTYNAVGKVETITDKESHVVSYGYDKMWNMISQTMPDGTVQAYKYDENNRLNVVEYPNGGTNTYTYDAAGNRTSVTDAEGNTIVFVYDAANQLVEVIEPDGAKTQNTYDREGNLVAVTNAMGYVTSYTYDDLGRRTSITNAEGATTSLFYNNMGQVERVCYPNGTQTIYTYDSVGKVTSVLNPDGSGETYEYDLKGNLISRANGMGNKISLKYDVLDRLVEIVNQVEGVRRFTYDAVGNLTSIVDEKGNKTTYEYSPNGNLIKVVDAAGNETFYEYDEMNRLTKTLCTGTNGEETQSTEFVWDAMGQIKSVTDPLGHVESYVYDKNGNMTSKTDRDGYTTKFTYGSHGRIEEIAYADGKTVEMSYDALRRLNEVKDWNGVTKINLDTLGRALSVTEPNGDTVGYEWGMMGEKKAVIYPDGKRAEYDYNTAMQLVSLHTESESIRYTYDEIGRLSQKALPNGLTTNYHYNEMGRVDEILHAGKEFTESYQYSFDAYGNKVGATKNRFGADTDCGHYTYMYDELSRLTEVRQNDTLLRKYGYDAFGNRTSKADYATGTEAVTNYIYNANNQLLSEEDGTVVKDYTYDNRGNLLKVATGADILKEFTFDATNQMTASMAMVDGVQKNATYAYNGLGHRVGQSISSLIPEDPEKKIRYTIDMTRQYYNLLQKSEDDTNQTYYWDGNVVGIESNGVENFYLQDDLGSPMHLVDAYGTSQECFAFDEFGENLSTSYNNTSQAFGFTGYQMDEVGGLYYAQARRYDANVGRFVSEDKVRGFIIMPYTLNHYGYCWNDPEDYVDVDGRFAILAAIAIGAVIGGLSGAVISAGTQTIAGMKEGKSFVDSVKSIDGGKVAGSAVSGLIVGGVGAIPGANLALTMLGGAAGSAAGSVVEQTINTKSVNPAEVFENAIVGGITSGIFYGVGKAGEAIVNNVKGTVSGKTTTDLIKDASKLVDGKKSQIKAAIEATGRTSPHRLRQLEQLKGESKNLVKTFFKEETLSSVKDAVKGAALTVFGVESSGDIVSGVTKRLLPFYDDGETAMDYMKKNAENMGNLLTANCCSSQ